MDQYINSNTNYAIFHYLSNYNNRGLYHKLKVVSRALPMKRKITQQVKK